MHGNGMQSWNMGGQCGLDLSFWSGADHRSRPDIPRTQVIFCGCPLRFGDLARPSLGKPTVTLPD